MLYFYKYLGPVSFISVSLCGDGQELAVGNYLQDFVVVSNQITSLRKPNFTSGVGRFKERTDKEQRM